MNLINNIKIILSFLQVGKYCRIYKQLYKKIHNIQYIKMYIVL